jgi:hypothetical protein
LYSFLKLLQPLAHEEIDELSFDAQFDLVVVDSSTEVQRPEVASWRSKMLT